MKKILSAEPIWQYEGLGLIRIITGCFLIYHGLEVFDPVKMKEYTQWDFFFIGPGKWSLDRALSPKNKMHAT
ncbi:hypothetical protein [Puia sp.]|uniref:hypothetical protein n=1 Tax=Puia sp. TaxID=2045100 RepID=UPI002F3E9574